MAFNTNNNIYTVVYSTIVVVIVAFLLAFVSKVLEPQSLANERIDEKKQILASLNIRDLNDSEVEATYDKVVQQDEILNAQGVVLKKGEKKDQDGFKVSRKEIAPDNLPLYVCKIGGDSVKYVIPLVGKGLWGSIWGYIALDSDLCTVYGVYFSHESETAGLGARITEPDFQHEFVGKKINSGKTAEIELAVVKHGKVKNPQFECDGITGATLTSNGVNSMLKQCLGNYKAFLKIK